MADRGKAVYRIVIDGSQEAIFRELTDTTRPLPAIFNARMHTTGMKPGARMQMRTGSGRRVIVDGDILECDPPNRFVHTHKFTMMDDPVCRVTYELRRSKLSSSIRTKRFSISGIIGPLAVSCSTFRLLSVTRIRYFFGVESVLTVSSRVSSLTDNG